MLKMRPLLVVHGLGRRGGLVVYAIAGSPNVAWVSDMCRPQSDQALSHGAGFVVTSLYLLTALHITSNRSY